MITSDDQVAADLLFQELMAGEPDQVGSTAGALDTARNMVSLARYVGERRGPGIPVVTHTHHRDELSVSFEGGEFLLASTGGEIFPIVCENGCPEGYLGSHKFSCPLAR